MLEISDLKVGYGDGLVVDGVSLQLGRGALAVLGRNGAGKTTLVKAVAGLLKPSAGDVRFEGSSLLLRRPDERIRLGIVYVPQDRPVFADLTVADHFRLAESTAGARRRELSEVLEIFPVLGDRFRQRAGTLSGGQRKFLAVATALVHAPRVLILDEPTEGVWPAVVDELAAVLCSLKESISILLVEQNLPMALTVADNVLVLQRGRVVLEGSPQDVADDPKLQAAIVV
jgi:branched-chain amino acid transport system ATP-binding protein